MKSASLVGVVSSAGVPSPPSPARRRNCNARCARLRPPAPPASSPPCRRRWRAASRPGPAPRTGNRRRRASRSGSPLPPGPARRHPSGRRAPARRRCPPGCAGRWSGAPAGAAGGPAPPAPAPRRSRRSRSHRSTVSVRHCHAACHPSAPRFAHCGELQLGFIGPTYSPRWRNRCRAGRPAPRPAGKSGHSVRKLSIVLALAGLLLGTVLVGWFGFGPVLAAVGSVGWGRVRA